MGLSAFIKNLTKGAQAPPFNPSIFDDPLALKTDWSPKASGGANFKTHTLKIVSATELRYEGSVFGKIFTGVFILFPLIFVAVWMPKMSAGDLFDWVIVLPMLIPLLFIVVGIYMFVRANTPLVINKGTGFCYRGKKRTPSSFTLNEDKNTIKLDQVKALQVIPERVRSKNSSYTSYEINFIFADGSRRNIVDHGSRKNIERDALTLSDFLEIPLWNKISNSSYLPKKSTITTPYNSLNPHDISEKHTATKYSTFNSELKTSADEQDLDADYDSMKRRKL